MKTQLFFAFLISISINAKSQRLKSSIPDRDTTLSTLVQNTKKFVIFKQQNPMFEIYQSTSEGDTSIYVLFEDAKYSYLSQLGAFSLTKEELKKFVDYWGELLDKKYKAGEAKIKFSNEITFSKMNGPMQTFYEMYYEGKNESKAVETKAQLRRMRQNVYNYLSEF